MKKRRTGGALFSIGDKENAYADLYQRIKPVQAGAAEERGMEKRVKRELVYRGSILDIYKDHMVFDNGHEEDWDFVAHRQGAAAVVAVDDDGKLLMVRQWRNALDREALELPAGARDFPEEDMAVCAARELEEETGFKPGKLTRLLSLRTTVAFCNERVDVFLAEDLTPGQTHFDPAEDIRLERYALSELLPLIFEGTIQDGKTVAGVLAYASWKERKKNHE